ncbi:MAG: hypothetical protein GY797_18210 [Deltaproteobacteria bacterium]|nr:hypothetical protein [Deltaproteobacteria bacterium]
MANPFQHLHTRIDRGRLLVDNDLEPRTLEITAEGYLVTKHTGGGVESVGNTTSDILLAGETFTGEWEEITDYAIIKVFISSDVGGAVGGLRFQQSPDMVDIDDEVYEYANSSPKMFTPNPIAKYFRMIYTNGASDQTRFNLATIYSYVYTKPTSHRLGDRVSGNDDAELTKAIIAFRDENDDTYHNIGTQHGMPTDIASVFAHNIWEEKSDTTDWIDLDSGVIPGHHLVTVPFSNLFTRIRNSTSDDPKTLLIHFNRTINAQQVGFGAQGGGDFSNMKLVLLGSGGVERTLLDDSANSVKYTSKNYQFAPQLFNAIRFEFHTTDAVTVSNITIQKAIVTESQIKAQQPDGVLVPIGATESGNLKISNAEDGLAIAKGDVEGSTFIHKFGSAPDFDPADGFATIWDPADDGATHELMNIVYSTTAAIDSISSSNAGDSQVMQVQGLDANFDLTLQEVTLNGQTRVALTTPLIRVFRIKNVGSVDLAGNVAVYEDTPLTGGIPTLNSKIRAIVQGANNQTEMAVYTIPAGKTGYMRDWYASTSGAKKGSSHVLKVLARPFGQVFQLKHKASIVEDGTSYIKHEYVEPEVFSEKTDIEMKVNTDQASSSIAGGFDIVLVDNE